MRKPTSAAVMIVVGVFLLVITLIYWGFGEAIAGSDKEGLPQSLAGLPLSTASYGSEAVQEISRLHGKEFPVESGAMGDYGASRQATLWVAAFADSATATQIVRSMQEKIALGNSPFQPTGENKIGERLVYSLDGMGQKHFYFQSGSQVVWLAAVPDISEQALQQTLRFYP